MFEEKLGWERPGWFLAPSELAETGHADAVPKAYDYYGGYLQSYHEEDHPLARPVNEDHLYHRLVDGECNFTWPASHEKVGSRQGRARPLHPPTRDPQPPTPELKSQSLISIPSSRYVNPGRQRGRRLQESCGGVQPVILWKVLRVGS